MDYDVAYKFTEVWFIIKDPKSEIRRSITPRDEACDYLNCIALILYAIFANYSASLGLRLDHCLKTIGLNDLGSPNDSPKCIPNGYPYDCLIGTSTHKKDRNSS